MKQILNELNDNIYEIYDKLKCLEKEYFKDKLSNLSEKEIHTIEAIGFEKKKMHDIAKIMLVKIPTITSMIDKLEKKEFVVRQRCTKDKRTVYVFLTDKGLDILNKHNEFHNSIFNEITTVFKKKEIDSLIGNLKRVNNFLSTKNANLIDNSSNLKLSDLKPGEVGKIIKVLGSGKIRKRLLEMGFIKGAEIKVEKYAPLQDPAEYIIKGYHLTLRRDECNFVLVEKISQ